MTYDKQLNVCSADGCGETIPAFQAFCKQHSKPIEADKELDELLSGWRVEKYGNQIKMPDELREALLAWKDAEVAKARIDELEKLNLYYMRHDGEGEHKLAEQFDKRLKELL